MVKQLEISRLHCTVNGAAEYAQKLCLRFLLVCCVVETMCSRDPGIDEKIGDENMKEYGNLNLFNDRASKSLHTSTLL